MRGISALEVAPGRFLCYNHGIGTKARRAVCIRARKYKYSEEEEGRKKL